MGSFCYQLVREGVLLVAHAAVDEHGPGADAAAAGGLHLGHGGAEAGRAVVGRRQRRGLAARGVPVREGCRVRGDVVEVAPGPGRRRGHQLRQHVRQARREGVPGAERRAVAQHRQRRRVGRRRGAARGGERQQQGEQRDGRKEERWWLG
jgi:hypothetical protein